eukprot:scaffold58059_cov45-Attheya_sp.AAC.4
MGIKHLLGKGIVVIVIVAVVATTASMAAVQHVTGKWTNGSFHESQMFGIVMCGKQQFTHVEFGNDASGRPQIRWHAPPQPQNDFRGPILTCIDHGGLFFMIIRGSSKVNHLNLSRCRNDLLLWRMIMTIPILTIPTTTTVHDFLVGGEQNIFELQIRVNERKTVQKIQRIQ